MKTVISKKPDPRRRQPDPLAALLRDPAVREADPVAREWLLALLAPDRGAETATGIDDKEDDVK